MTSKDKAKVWYLQRGSWYAKVLGQVPYITIINTDFWISSYLDSLIGLTTRRPSRRAITLAISTSNWPMFLVATRRTRRSIIVIFNKTIKVQFNHSIARGLPFYLIVLWNFGLAGSMISFTITPTEAPKMM